MNDRYIAGRYLEKNPEWHIQDSPWKARIIATILSKNSVSASVICEVGCGAGGVLANLSSLLPGNVRFLGYDISPQAYAICQKKANERISFYQGDFFATNHVDIDVLLVVDVVEHLENYLEFLRNLRSKARYKVFHVPLELTCHRILRGKPLLDSLAQYGHLHYFTKDTFLAALDETGYAVKDFIYSPVSTFSRAEEGRGLCTNAANLMRRVLFSLYPDFTARSLGGYSLLVLAE